jgi:histidyl-tRNA synthetase
METTVRAVKGMHDLFEEDLATWRWLEAESRNTFLKYGYGEIRTPLLEETRLFARGVGETTDIVEKEMYSFLDRDKKSTSLCLRPENTASVVRALLQNGRLNAGQETKVFYMGPMFRRERPQKGRYRQFHQFGAEAFGIDNPSIDVEMMAMLDNTLQALGLKNIKLAINTLGDPSDRSEYTSALKEYFGDHCDILCPDCLRRMEKNPLRILDCKVPACAGLKSEAPEILNYLGDASKAHFDEVQNGLQHMGIEFAVEPRLVRGLDYYTRTVFEALAESGLGSQNAVAAGGRYDGLVEQLGGRPTPAIGFAAGIERLALLLPKETTVNHILRPDLMLIGADEAGRGYCVTMAQSLRAKGVYVDLDHSGKSVKAQMRRADRMQTAAVMVIGANELSSKLGRLKTMATGDSISLPLDDEKVIQALKD